MITQEAHAIFNTISKENLLQLARTYDKQFDAESKDVELAKMSLFNTAAFSTVLTAFEQVIKTKYNNTDDGPLTTLVVELLDIVHDDVALKQRKNNFLEAFDAFVDPVVYENQSYTVVYYMDGSEIMTSIYHEDSTLLFDYEIIEEARSNILDDLRVLMASPLSYKEFEKQHANMLTYEEFEITVRDIHEQTAKAM